MPHIRAQAILNAANGIPADAVMNTFYFETAADTTTEYEKIEAVLNEFYEADVISTNSVSTYLSLLMAGTGSIKMYDMADPTPRTVKFIGDLAWTVATDLTLPAEVAAVVSFHAQAVSGQAQARRRGRVYIGPLNYAADHGSYPSLLDPTLQDVLVAAANRLYDSCQTAEIVWEVFSETNNAFYPVVGGWVDNAWDTQRRRGRPATVRDTWLG